MIKSPTKANLGRVCLVYSLIVQSIQRGHIVRWQRQQASGHTVPVIRGHRKMDANAQLALLLLLSWGPVHEMVLYMLMELLPSPVKPVWRDSQTYQEKCLLGDSKPVKSAMKINNHS